MTSQFIHTDRQPMLQRLAEIAGLYLKLGTTAFGGPVAHIAMMHFEADHLLDTWCINSMKPPLAR